MLKGNACLQGFLCFEIHLRNLGFLSTVATPHPRSYKTPNSLCIRKERTGRQVRACPRPQLPVWGCKCDLCPGILHGPAGASQLPGWQAVMRAGVDGQCWSQDLTRVAKQSRFAHHPLLNRKERPPLGDSEGDVLEAKQKRCSILSPFLSLQSSVASRTVSSDSSTQRRPSSRWRASHCPAP